MTSETIMIKEHERIVLSAPVPAEGLEAGDVGTVVHVYKDAGIRSGVHDSRWKDGGCSDRGICPGTAGGKTRDRPCAYADRGLAIHPKSMRPGRLKPGGSRGDSRGTQSHRNFFTRFGLFQPALGQRSK
jgi:hypothetical protein